MTLGDGTDGGEIPLTPAIDWLSQGGLTMLEKLADMGLRLAVRLVRACGVVLCVGAALVLAVGPTAGAATGGTQHVAAKLWVSRYNGPANGFENASGVAASPDGSRVFVTGHSTGTPTGMDYATLAYDASTGNKLWLKRYNGPGNGDDSAYSVAASPDGSRVFVTGASAGTGGFGGLDYATVAYDASTGDRLWVKRYNGPGTLDAEEAHSVAASPDGSKVFVTGLSPGITTGFDYATVAYDA